MTSIGPAGLPHAATARVAGAQAVVPTPTQPEPGPATPGVADAWVQELQDTLAVPGDDGWSPRTIVAVTSKLPPKFVGSALKFATGGTREDPGQRLSTAQVDALAPYYAATFHVDEDFVRRELGKVYLYVGGPAAQSGQAMTVGHHVYLPDEDSVRYILSPGGKRWLAHELSHTMQFLDYDQGDTYTFMDSYVQSIMVGRKPERPGAGGGAWIWGALFTGARHGHDVHGTFGAASLSAKDRAGMSVVPAATIGVPLALVTAGALAGARTTAKKVPGIEEAIGSQLLGSSKSLTTAMGVVGLPMLAGSAIGGFASALSTRQQGWAGAAAGAALAAATLHHADAFHGGLAAKALAGGAIAMAAGLGWTSARISGNTVRGWSQNDQVLHDFFQRQSPDPKFADALHDAHWEEADAEAIAQKFVKDPGHDYAAEAAKYAGKTPRGTDSWRNRVDWTITAPLMLGVPAAAIVGSGVLATRTGMAVVSGAAKGDGVFGTFGDAIASISSDGRGIGNSLGVGAAVTLAPLVFGGLGANVADAAGFDQHTSILVGTGVAAASAGVLLTALLHGTSKSLLTATPKVLAGMAVAAGAGYLASNLAVHAAHPVARVYDISGGLHAHADGTPVAHRRFGPF